MPRAQGAFQGLSRLKFFLLLFAGLILGLFAVHCFVGYAERKSAASMARTAGDRLVLYSGTLRSALSKYSYLPHILASHPAVLRLVAEGDNADTVNRYLEDVNAASGSMELFILNREGTTVAASNWNRDESFVGHDYRYRPYYQDAMRLGLGGYFGVGATTGRPGFFFTERIGPSEDPLGVAVAKVDLAMLQREWRDGGETVFITDEHGVIFLSSRDDWRYRAARRLSDAAQKAMLYQRQYGSSLPERIELREYEKSGVKLMELGGRTWLYTTRPLSDYGWTIWFCSPVAALEQQTEALWLIGCGAVCMLLLLLLLARIVYAWRRAKREARETEKIRAVNRRLAEEIRIRKKTERDLLAAQDDLLHAGRMAALGQVAASLVHELSQPVTSMSMFVSSCRKLAQEGRHDKVAETVGHMANLVQRIKSLIEQLRLFARKPRTRLALVSLRDALDNALSVLQFKQEAAGCAPEVVCPPEAAVFADALQLEQALINLIQNALDAVSANNGEKRVTVTVEAEKKTVRISVADNGPGLDSEVKDKIFTPFFTTKKSGEGIGLGLAIADNIIRSMHGVIETTDVHPHGTRFAFALPRAGKTGNAE